MDFAQCFKNKIVITQDTEDDEKFEAVSIDITPGELYRDSLNQKH